MRKLKINTVISNGPWPHPAGPMTLFPAPAPLALRRVLPQLRLPTGVTGALGAADMSQIAPAQYLADMVVVLSDQQTGKPIVAVVIEPQGRDRKTKKVTAAA